MNTSPFDLGKTDNKTEETEQEHGENNGHATLSPRTYVSFSTYVTIADVNTESLFQEQYRWPRSLHRGMLRMT